MGKYLLADEKPGHITTLVTGRSIDLLNPRADDIFIEDIAASLSKLEPLYRLYVETVFGGRASTAGT